MFSRDRENLDGIKLGAFQMAHFCNFYHPGKNPAWMVFTLPFLELGDWDVQLAVGKAMLKHPAFIADMDQWNAMPYNRGSCRSTSSWARAPRRKRSRAGRACAYAQAAGSATP